jgi:hypothetical protein
MVVLVLVGLGFALVGTVLLLNFGGSSGRIAAFYRRVPHPFRFLYDRPSYIRVSGAFYVVIGLIVAVWALVKLR